MTSVGVHEAKTHLSRLIQRVESGEEVLITRGGRPVARIVPVTKKLPRAPGRLKDAVRIGRDFDAPLPADLWASDV